MSVKCEACGHEPCPHTGFIQLRGVEFHLRASQGLVLSDGSTSQECERDGWVDSMAFGMTLCHGCAQALGAVLKAAAFVQLARIKRGGD